MKILFYNDSGVFGGHEVETVYAVSYLIRHTNLDIGFIFYRGNKKLHEKLKFLVEGNENRVSLYTLNFKSGSLQSIRTLFSLRKIDIIRNIINTYKPEVVIVSQGGIEVSSLGLLAAYKSGCKIISYIPMAFKLAEIEFRLGVIRDIVNQYFYKLPNRFITSSNSMSQQIIRHGVSSEKIRVVYGVIDTNLYCQTSSLENSTNILNNYGITNVHYVIGIVGRIQFKQKGHDFLINALSENVDQLGNFKLLVVGDGPDRYALESMVNQKGLAEHVIFIPWHDDLSFVYSSLDVVLIPSRFEGLPLVMLESMYHNVPVLASNRDGMKEVLPEEWLFDCCDSDSFIKSLLRIKNMDNTDFIKKNKLKIISEFDVENFGRSFYEAITNN